MKRTRKHDKLADFTMRQPKPYYKSTHHAWYANIGPNKRPVRLASEEEGEKIAWEKYHAEMAGRQPLNGDCRVSEVVARFLDHHRRQSAPTTLEFYAGALDSFVKYAGRLQVSKLKAHHVTEWVDQCHHDAKYKGRLTGDKTGDTRAFKLALHRFSLDDVERECER